MKTSETDTWLGGDGTWSNGADWSAGVPGFETNAIVPTTAQPGNVLVTAPIETQTLRVMRGASVSFQNTAGESFFGDSPLLRPSVNSGLLAIDAGKGQGGSTVDFMNELINNGVIQVGASDNSLAAPTTLLIDDLGSDGGKPGSIEIDGGASATATVIVSSYSFSSSTMKSLVLSGHSLFEANGPILSAIGSVTIDGPNAFLAQTGLGTTSNSALASLSTIANTLTLENGAAATTSQGVVIEGASGHLTIGDGSTLVSRGVSTVADGGLLDLAAINGVSLFQAADLTNLGTVRVTGTGSGSSTLTALGAFENDATVDLVSAHLKLNAVLTGTGTIDLAAATGGTGSTLEVTSSVGANQVIAFQSSATTPRQSVILDRPQYFDGTIDAFGQGDQIDLAEFGAGTTFVYTENSEAGSGFLQFTDGARMADINLTDFTGNASNIKLTTSGTSTIVSYQPGSSTDAGPRTDTWVGTLSNEWTTGGNWADGAPYPTTNTIINGGLVQVDSPITAASMRLTGSADVTFATNSATSAITGTVHDSGLLVAVAADAHGLPGLTIGGSLMNRGTIQVGTPGGTVQNTTLSVGQLIDTAPAADVVLYGSAIAEARIHVGSPAGIGPAGEVEGFIDLMGDALIDFVGSQQIQTISSSGSLAIRSSNAFIADDGLGLNANTALEGLSNVDGDLQISDGASVTTTGSLAVNDINGSRSEGGVIDLDGQLIVGGGLTVETGAAIDASDGEVQASALTNNGDITVAMAGSGSFVLATTNGFTNDGLFDLQFAQAEVSGDITGTGKIELARYEYQNGYGGSTLRLGGGGSSGQAVDFDQQAGSQQLILESPKNFAATINGFGTGDTIDLLGTTATSLQYAGGQLTVMNGTSAVDVLAIAGAYQSGNFNLTQGSAGDALIAYAATPAKAASGGSMVAMTSPTASLPHHTS